MVGWAPALPARQFSAGEGPPSFFLSLSPRSFFLSLSPWAPRGGGSGPHRRRWPGRTPGWRPEERGRGERGRESRAAGVRESRPSSPAQPGAGGAKWFGTALRCPRRPARWHVQWVRWAGVGGRGRRRRADGAQAGGGRRPGRRRPKKKQSSRRFGGSAAPSRPSFRPHAPARVAGVTGRGLGGSAGRDTTHRRTEGRHFLVGGGGGGKCVCGRGVSERASERRGERPLVFVFFAPLSSLPRKTSARQQHAHPPLPAPIPVPSPAYRTFNATHTRPSQDGERAKREREREREAGASALAPASLALAPPPPSPRPRSRALPSPLLSLRAPPARRPTAHPPGGHPPKFQAQAARPAVPVRAPIGRGEREKKNQWPLPLPHSHPRRSPPPSSFPSLPPARP